MTTRFICFISLYVYYVFVCHVILNKMLFTESVHFVWPLFSDKFLFSSSVYLGFDPPQIFMLNLMSVSLYLDVHIKSKCNDWIEEVVFTRRLDSI